MPPAPTTCPVCKAPVPPGAAVCDVCGLVFASAGGGQVLAPAPSAPITRPLTPGQVLDSGNYTVERALSKGGMGALYLARDRRAFDRPVVIKTLLDYFDASDPAEVQEARDRFIAEARTLSQVKHPNFPQIFAHFQDGAQTCIVMEYVEGRDLSLGLSRIDDQSGAQLPGQPYPAEQVARWGVDICRMLEHLASHQPPIIHHDIKPANLVLDSHSGEIFLVDFGTAKAHLLGPRRGGGSGAFGTPGYAPPEQYRGQSEPRSDIYALAATLYHLASDDDPADHPFSFPKLAELGPLGAALAPALEHKPARRPSAPALRAAFERLLEPPAPIPANSAPRPAPAPARAAPQRGRAAPKQMPVRLGNILFIGIFSGLLALTVFTLQMFTGGIREETSATEAPQQATSAPSPTPRRNPTVGPAGVASTALAGFGGAAPTVSIPTSGPSVAIPTGALWRGQGSERLISALAFDAQGEALVSGGPQGFVELWDIAEGGPLLTLRGEVDDLSAIALTASAEIIGVGSEGLIQIWPLADSDFALIESRGGAITTLALGPAGELAVGFSSGIVRLWDAARAPGAVFQAGCTGPVSGIRFSASGGQITITDTAGCLQIWERAGPSVLVGPLRFSNSRHVALAPLADGGLLLAHAGLGISISRLEGDFLNSQPVSTEIGAVAALALSGDGELLAIANDTGAIRVIRTADQSAVARFQLPAGSPTSLIFAPDSATLASGDSLGFITLWKVAP